MTKKAERGPLPWFRMYHEIIDDEKVRLIAFEDRWHYVAILACKCKGILDDNADPAMLTRKLAVKLGVQIRELDEIHRRLMEVDLVDEHWQPVGWNKRQRASDKDVTAAERQRRYRERMGKTVSNA